MTLRPPVVAAAVLAAGACLGVPAAAQALVTPGPALRAAVSAGTGDAVRLLRSDPPDGAWEQAGPGRVRLWFAGAAGRTTASAKVSTPERPGMGRATTTWADGVLTVRVPDDGPGEYRVLWFLVAPDAGSSSAAGTLSFRVGAGAGSGHAKAFTIPPSATGAAAQVLAASSAAPTTPSVPAPSAAPGAGGRGRSPSSRAPSLAPSRTSGRASSGSSAALPPPPVPPPAGPAWRRLPLTALSPAALLASGAGGLLALGLGAGLSLRLGARAAARPR